MTPRRFTDEQEKEIGKLYLSGISTKKIARDMNLPGKDSILGALRRQGIKQRSPSERNRLYAVDENAFDIITPEIAYWWGFLYADGYVHRRSLVLSLKWSDIDHLEKFKKFMKSESPIKKYHHYINSIDHPACYLGLTSRHLINRLRELGITPHRKNFQAVRDNLPDNMVRNWLLGFLDGDGTIYITKNGQYQIGFMGSLEVMEWIKTKLPFVNTSKRIYKHSISNIYYLNFSGNKICQVTVNYLYKNQHTFMNRKYKLAQSIPPPYIHSRDKLGRYCS